MTTSSANGATATARSRVSQELLDRMPPANLDAEKALLGSILHLPAALDEIGGTLGAGDFYADAHGRVWACLTSLRDAGKP
jgi:replicative DNA helicase